MNNKQPLNNWLNTDFNTALLLEDGTFLQAFGYGQKGFKTAEICFNTAMTGYQETLSEPSYHQQIIIFTAPHIGNTGVNEFDNENLPKELLPNKKLTGACGLITRELPSLSSNYRAAHSAHQDNHSAHQDNHNAPEHSTNEHSTNEHSTNEHSPKGDFTNWCEKNNLTGLYDLDTRALTKHISKNGMMKCCIYYGKITNISSLKIEMQQRLKAWSGINNQDLASKVTISQPAVFYYHKHDINKDYAQKMTSHKRWENLSLTNYSKLLPNKTTNSVKEDLANLANLAKKDLLNKTIAIIDLGCKKNIVENCLAPHYSHATPNVFVFPVGTQLKEILKYNIDAFVLSNGPGDPQATFNNHKNFFQELIKITKPILAICLGHQILGLAFGARTIKMHQGHHGINHPVYNIKNKMVKIVSMNHSFVLDKKSFPPCLVQSEFSLFDQTNCSFTVKDKNIFSVQYHPEASPGPHESSLIFQEFFNVL